MNNEIVQKFLDDFNEAQNLFKENKFLESLEKYKILSQKNPKHVSVLNNIALIYEKLDNYKEAIIYFEKCIKILPNENILIHNLANAYCRSEKYIEAYPLLKKIIHLDYANEPNCEKYAVCLFYTKTKQETKEFIDSVMSKYPKNSLLNGLLGKTLMHLNLHKEGLKYIQESTGQIEFSNSGVKYLS